MANKKFVMTLASTCFQIEADQEGNCRYMVRISSPELDMARIRIGYLTGSDRTWVAEFFGGKRPSVPATSAKAACKALAEFAITQPAISSKMTA